MTVILSYGALKIENDQLKGNIALLQNRLRNIFTVQIEVKKNLLLEKL